ncbi:MAG: hypothetical protein IID45_10770, partial [Planctomycetes bacterium]|nr:hypothetical protein [Planctomycetota bacterium]
MKRETMIWTVLLVLGGLFLAIRASTSGMGVAYVQDENGRAVAALPAERIAGVAQISWSRTFGIWAAALFTLCIFSFLYRDNPAYKFAESIVVGVSAAYVMVVGFWTVVVPNLVGKLFPAWIQSWAIPGLSAEREEHWWLYVIPL